MNYLLHKLIMEQKQKKEWWKKKRIPEGNMYISLILKPEEIQARMKTIHKLKLFYCYGYIRKI